MRSQRAPHGPTIGYGPAGPGDVLLAGEITGRPGPTGVVTTVGGSSGGSPPADWSVPSPRTGEPAAEPARLAPRRDGVLTVKEALAAGFSRAEIRRRVDGRAWQLCPGEVLVTQPGPLTLIQRLWCALVSIGPDALLGGASAAALGGLRGCEEPWLTVILASGRRVSPRPGVKIRATARLGDEDLARDGWPPRTALPRSLIDMAEWAPSHDEARTVLALAVSSGIVETGEIRAALARRGPIARRQVIGDALDDLDAAASWVPDLLFRRLEARHGLPPARRGLPGPAGRLDLLYEAWRVRVEIGAIPSPGIRTAAEVPPPGGAVTAFGPRGSGLAAAPWPRAAARGLSGQRADWLVLKVPLRLLLEEPDRVGVAVATTLRQRGAAARRPATSRGVSPLGDAFAPALDQAVGPTAGTGFGPTGTGFGSEADGHLD